MGTEREAEVLEMQYLWPREEGNLCSSISEERIVLQPLGQQHNCLSKGMKPFHIPSSTGISSNFSNSAKGSGLLPKFVGLGVGLCFKGSTP